ncbi:MAG TPA: PilZ domain-containing protein [Candidatus Baltobacteraceae bacterium]|nr:PilZ domain-containing protein [Candidatus Baltobacteraceae bacterium]
MESNHTPAQSEDEKYGHHREFERVGDTLLVSYSISDDFAPEFTETYDIALGGMAMITNAELQTDAPIVVQLELRGDSRPVIRLKGTVRWSRFDPMLQRYRTGVAFTDVDDSTRKDLTRYIDTLRLLRDMGVI